MGEGLGAVSARQTNSIRACEADRQISTERESGEEEIVAIRAAEPHERAALEDLQRRASLVWEEYRAALLAHPDAIEIPAEQIESGRAFVAELQGKVVGFNVVLRRHDGDAELDGLFVEPSRWKRGIGRALVQDAARFAASEGANTLRVVANPRALGFYEACGFERVGEESTRFGVGITMHKNLG